MIQASELKVGNWVDAIIVTGKNKKVSAIQINGVYTSTPYPSVKSFITSYSRSIDLKDLSGIPLSAEILEKCGFKYGIVKGITRLKNDIDEPDPEGDTYYWDLKVPKNNHVEDLSTFNLVQFGKDDDIKFAHQWLRVKIKHLHQLQNLYFTLTGQELKINL